jgi:hypothetical protein
VVTTTGIGARVAARLLARGAAQRAWPGRHAVADNEAAAAPPAEVAPGHVDQRGDPPNTETNYRYGGQSMPIFHLNLASLKRASGPHRTVVARNIKLTVTSPAATALNSGLGVSTFKGGMNFGIATLTVRYARGHR